jgi:hypothetical protein
MSGSNDSGVEWAEYARIPPGVYSAYSAVSKHYFDKAYRRWVCFIRWDVLSNDGMRVLARVPLWWTLGGEKRPRAKRRSKYFGEWIKANGGPPTRGDRLAPSVRNRMARVEIGDTDPLKSPAPYSVVRKILQWETGARRRHSVSKSHSQGRHCEDAGFL